jgi:DUF3014 family protein
MRGAPIPLHILLPSAALLALGLFWMNEGGQSVTVAPRAARPDPPLAASRAHGLRPEHPVPPSPLRALPALSRSDAVVREAIRKTRGGEALAPLLDTDDLLRGFVRAVDELPRQGPAGIDGRDRSSVAIASLDRLDVNGALSLYWRFYPLLQEAYDDLEPGDGYFNDRVVAVIDHLLERCAVECSVAQQRLLQMDPAVSGRIAAKLTQVRKRLALRPPAQ